MTADTSEFDQPCPHGGSVVTCNDCLSEYVTAERLIEEATGDPFLSPAQTNPTATPWDGVEGRDLTFGHDADSEET